MEAGEQSLMSAGLQLKYSYITHALAVSSNQLRASLLYSYSMTVVNPID